MANLGNRLRGCRERKGWTQLFASKQLEIPNQNLSNYERGFRTPDHETLSRLAELYEVSVDWLLGRSDYSHMTEAQSKSLRTIKDIRNEILNDQVLDVDGKPFSPERKSDTLRQIDLMIKLKELQLGEEDRKNTE